MMTVDIIVLFDIRSVLQSFGKRFVVSFRSSLGLLLDVVLVRLGMWLLRWHCRLVRRWLGSISGGVSTDGLAGCPKIASPTSTYTYTSAIESRMKNTILGMSAREMKTPREVNKVLSSSFNASRKYSDFCRAIPNTSKYTASIKAMAI